MSVGNYTSGDINILHTLTHTSYNDRAFPSPVVCYNNSKSMIFAIVFMSHESPLLIGIRKVVVGVVESISEPGYG